MVRKAVDEWLEKVVVKSGFFAYATGPAIFELVSRRVSPA
jgi:hypothetical protein